GAIESSEAHLQWATVRRKELVVSVLHVDTFARGHSLALRGIDAEASIIVGENVDHVSPIRCARVSPNYQAQRRRDELSARGRGSARVLSAAGRPRPGTLC